MGTNERRNQLLNEIITVRDYTGRERKSQSAGQKEMDHRNDEITETKRYMFIL